MTRWLIAAGVGVAFAGLSARADDPPKADPPKVEKKANENPFAVLAKERVELRSAMMKKYREAKEDEQNKIYSEWQKEDKDFQAKLSALAFEHAATRPAYEHLVAAFVQGGASATKAAEAIRTHHLEKPYVHEKNALLMLASGKDGEELVQLVEAKNPNPVSKAVAAFAIGSMAKDRLGQAKSDDKKAELLKSAEAAFGRVAKYDDGKSKEIKQYVAQAAGALAGLKNIDALKVGKPVPDIDGVDLDGKAFKLSDYKGKVVLLDYWAFW